MLRRRRWPFASEAPFPDIQTKNCMPRGKPHNRKPYSPTIQSLVASTNSLLYRIEIITRKRLDEIPYNFSMIRRGSWHKSRDYRGSIVDETIYRRGSRDARTAGGNVTRRLEYVAAGITGNWWRSVTITSDAYFSGGYARPVRHNKVI